jgi:hypothetical protein
MKTNAGTDFAAGVMGSTSSNGTGAYAAANYIGVTANAAAAVATDTTLAGEVATGTLARVQASYAHTNGTSSYTLTNTFTSDRSITLAKIGIFNASSDGTLVFETLLATTAVLVSGDQCLCQDTISL